MFRKLALSVASILVLLALLEAMLGVVYWLASGTETGNSVAMHVPCEGCSRLYGPNPEHPEIGPDGLRLVGSRVEAGQDARRILILGDSVTFGTGVPASKTFSHLLQGELRGVEVTNAGVSGYTTYNELHFFLERGAE